MASHDQSFKAGEAKGQTQEKSNQMMSNIGDKAQAAKDKTAQTTQAAKDKTQQAAQAAKENFSSSHSVLGDFALVLGEKEKSGSEKEKVAD
ncbi:late embryogenesis abundant protein 2-like [Arachis stenosperma]|uniref:late embryogenesis abundant protein 2-like n=1 Tax=Arachis stenosperma TaxID=217475 RepID=UPI0025AD44E2|nr:late embryogenesis abundant protein 2-like [Arachis stenosperma]